MSIPMLILLEILFLVALSLPRLNTLNLFNCVWILSFKTVECHKRDKVGTSRFYQLSI